MELVWDYHNDEPTHEDRQNGTESEIIGATVGSLVFGVNRCFIQGKAIVMWGVQTFDADDDFRIVIEPDRIVASVEIGKQRCQDWLDDRIVMDM